MSYDQSIAEYERKNLPSPGNPRYNEAWALIEAARRIAAVVQYGDFKSPTDKRRLRDALRLNLRIWTIIQAEQAVGENPLPPDLQRNILTLCQFIDKHTMDTMLNPSPEKAATLININRNIAAGLMGSPEDLPEDETAELATAETDEKGDPVKIEI